MECTYSSQVIQEICSVLIHPSVAGGQNEANSNRLASNPAMEAA
jgi:hypothetical protein